MPHPPARPGISPESLREFARLIAECKTVTEAARLAGFPNSERPHHVMRTGNFSRAFDAAMKQRFQDAAPEALDVLLRLMRDPKVPAKVQLDAAKTLADRAGYGALAIGGAREDEEGAFGLKDLTPEELAPFIARLEREKANAARRVGGTASADGPSAPPDFLQ